MIDVPTFAAPPLRLASAAAQGVVGLTMPNRIPTILAGATVAAVVG